jgi:hypothetical protein
LKKYDVNLSSNQKNEILMALPGKESSGIEEQQEDGSNKNHKHISNLRSKIQYYNLENVLLGKG